MNQTIGVNITPQSFQPTLHYSQGDVGRVFVVNVTDYSIPSGATVTCVATKPSGMGFTVSGTVSGNTVTFTSTAEMTDEWGRFPAEIRIASGNTLLGTANFLMIGEKDPHPASTIDGTQEELIPQLTLLVNRVEAAAESVHDLTVSATTLAAGSDATATYDSTNNSITFGIPRGADGDVTRSEFNDLKSDLEDAVSAIGNVYKYNNDWELGLTMDDYGQLVGNGHAAISPYIYAKGMTFCYAGPRTIDANYTYYMYVCEFDINHHFIRRTPICKSNLAEPLVVLPVQEDCVYVRFVYGTQIDMTATLAEKFKVVYGISSLENSMMLLDSLTNYNKFISNSPDLLVGVGYTEGYYISANGTITFDDRSRYTDIMPIVEGAYELWYQSDGNDNNIRIHAYDENGDWLEQIAVAATGTITVPQFISFSVDETIKGIRISTKRTNALLILNRVDTTVKSLKLQMDAYTERVIGRKTLIDSVSWIENYAIGENGAISFNNNFHYTNLIPVTNGSYRFIYKGVGVNNNTRIHAYDSNGDWIKQILLSASGTSTSAIVVDIPCKDYSYIRVSTAKVTTIIDLLSPSLIETSADNNSIGLHTAPENEGVLNAIKRARQMTDLEWEAGFDLPRAFMDTGDTYLTSHSQTYQGTFKEGKKYKGLPYSDQDSPYRWLGIEVPFETFCSAIEKNNSVIARQSPYTPYGADYYGCVCTSLTCYALDLPYTYSSNYPSISGMSKITTVNDSMDVSLIKLGDILQISGHCAIVTDIYKDAWGQVEYIEISEATRQGNSNRSHLTGKYGSVCHRITMTVDEFKSWFSTFSIYRYANIDKVTYHPCAYVPMPDEGNRVCIHDYPLMPYKGNKATYGTSSAPTITIIFDTDAYTTLVVYKNGSLFDKYNVEGLTSYNVVCDTDEAKYTACLAVLDANEDISYSTQSVEWYCRPHGTPVVSVSSGEATISVTNSGEFKPYCVIVGNTFVNGGYTRLFDSDYTKTVDGNNVTYSFKIPFAYEEEKACKLFLRSEEWGVCEYNFTITP